MYYVIFTKASEAWSELSEAEKSFYEEKRLKAKDIWEQKKQEYQDYINSLTESERQEVLKAESKKSSKRNPSKDPSKPKKEAVNPYHLFFIEQCSAGLYKGQKGPEISKKVAEMWKNLTEEEKHNYKEKFNDLIKKYRADLEEWKSK